MQNVVQLEFSHVGGRGDGDFEALQAECAERLATGSPIKTVVRLYDEGQSIERFIDKWEGFRRRTHQALKKYEEAEGFARFWAYIKYARFERQFSNEVERAERLEFAQVFFADQADFWENVTIQTFDFSFRPVLDDEVYDLKTAVSRAKGVDIFLFAPNENLCSDINTCIAQAMW